MRNLFGIYIPIPIRTKLMHAIAMEELKTSIKEPTKAKTEQVTNTFFLLILLMKKFTTKTDNDIPT